MAVLLVLGLSTIGLWVAFFLSRPAPTPLSAPRTLVLSRVRKRDILVLAILSTLLSAIVGPCVLPSGFSNCVVVEAESDFTGRLLLHDRAQRSGPAQTTECEELDNRLDAGNGPGTGRVRWVECMRGPDCDESGMW